MTIFRDFQGPRRDIGIARPRHSITCLENETCLKTSSSDIEDTVLNKALKASHVFSLPLLITSVIAVAREKLRGSENVSDTLFSGNVTPCYRSIQQVEIVRIGYSVLLMLQ